MVLLRFAPSPTGALHLGGLRTALYNHLFAKKHGGKWILRIEDTDAARYVPTAVDGIRNALAWAGLPYDFGPGMDGPHGPYFQSERLDLYHSYTRRLLESGHAYRCFCSPDKLAATREKLARTGSNATYDKSCLHLTEEEVARRVRAGEKSIVRLNDDNLPDRSSPTDIVFGILRDAHASLPTDPVLLKSDLFPTYHLASVVDDHEMDITHVLRGEEWLPSLPLHPRSVFMSGPQASSRNGDVSVLDFMRRGWEPESVINWLALAGWGVHHENGRASPPGTPSTQPPDSTTLMTASRTQSINLDLSSLTHRRNVLDPAKLAYLNKHHLMRSWQSEQGIAFQARRVHDVVKAAFPHSPYTNVEYITRVISVLQGRITNLHDVPTLAPFFFVELDYELPEAHSMKRGISADDYGKSRTVNHVLRRVILQLESSSPSTQADIAVFLHDACEKTGLKSKVFMTALRHALSGMKAGPSLPEIIDVLGTERTAQRLKLALSAHKTSDSK
ncbi:hypothetical protein F4604DRAFT_1931611 [Suillus subluteus]|nr:hypothetical protein F4604DRAFT_1931611 [Suillus subluteus]